LVLGYQVAKITIPVEKLPAPNLNGDHAIQFRIVSDDRNRISAWSNLFIIKSIGQYRPLESDVTMIIGSNTVDVSWDTPSIYNYYTSASMSSASIQHNHTQDFKRHDTDVFIQWGSGSVMSNFEYHDRVNSDTTTIVIPQGSASVRVVGTVATHNIPKRLSNETESQYNQRVTTYLEDLMILFKIFDTKVQSLTWYN